MAVQIMGVQITVITRVTRTDVTNLHSSANDGMDPPAQDLDSCKMYMRNEGQLREEILVPTSDRIECYAIVLALTGNSPLLANPASTEVFSIQEGNPAEILPVVTLLMRRTVTNASEEVSRDARGENRNR